VFFGLSQDDVVQADGSEFKGGSFEKTVDNGVSTHLVTRPLKEESTHWRVMGDLLGNEAIVRSNNFVGFSQKRVEGLSCSSINFGVLSNQEASHIGSSFDWVLFSNSSIHQFVERCYFRDLLKHTYRFIKPNRHCDLGHILSNCTFKDSPYTETLIFRN